MKQTYKVRTEYSDRGEIETYFRVEKNGKDIPLVLDSLDPKIVSRLKKFESVQERYMNKVKICENLETKITLEVD